MTPYSRFRLVSNSLAAALVIGAVCAVWPVASGMIAAATSGLTPSYWAAAGAVAAGLVLGWMLLTELVLPLVFHFGPVRRMILGRDFAEGTWLQAERGAAGEERITVLRIRPAGFGFRLSGHTFDSDFRIDSNRMVEFSAFDGPMLRYVYRSLMPDGSGNQPHALSELAFDRIRSAPKSYLGFVQATGSPRKVRVEGVKLTKWSDRRRLRKADQRAEVLETYWEVFFGARAERSANVEIAAPPPTVRRPVIIAPAGPAFAERRSEDAATLDTTVIVPRRRASDWRSEDTTPTADRIRARMMEEAPEIEEEDLYEEEIDDEIEEEAAEGEDEVMLEDLYEDAEEEDAEDEDDEIDAEADESEEEFEDEEDEFEDDAETEDDEEDVDADEEYEDSEDAYEDEEDLEEEIDAETEDEIEDEEVEDDAPVLRRNRFAGR